MIGRRIAALALAAAALLGLAACSDPARAASPHASAPALRLGYFATVTHAPAIVGVQDRLFAKSLGSTTLTAKVFDAGPAATEALLSGAIDAAFLGPGPTTNAYVRSRAITVVAGAAANGAELVVKPGIASAADLRGKRLATPQLANTQDIALRYWLKQHGLTTTPTGGGDVSVLPQSNGDAVTAFRQGQIDGAWLPEPYATELVDAGGQVLVDERDLWPGKRFVVTDLVVRTDYLRRYPGTVAGLVTGLIAAEDRIAADPAAARFITGAAIATVTGTRIPEPVLKTAWSHVAFTVDPVAPSLREGAKHAQAVGLLTGTVDLAGLYDLGPLNTALRAAGKPPVSAG